MDEFTKSYIEAAFWSTTDNADESGGEPLDKNYGIDDLAPATLEAMERDAAAFQRNNAQLLERAYAEGKSHRGPYDDAMAGFHFWLTRSGAGAGFWDGDLPEDLGDKLTEASKEFGEADLYVGDDKLIYQSGDEQRANEASAPDAACGCPDGANAEASRIRPPLDDADARREAMREAHAKGFTMATRTGPTGRRVVVYKEKADGTALAMRLFKKKGQYHWTRPEKKPRVPRTARGMNVAHEPHVEEANDVASPEARDFNTPQDGLQHAAAHGFTHFTKMGHHKIVVFGPGPDGTTTRANMFKRGGRFHFTEPTISKHPIPRVAKQLPMPEVQATSVPEDTERTIPSVLANAPASRVWRPGETAYVPHATDVEKVTIVERGDVGRNLRRPLHDPYVIRAESGPDAGNEGVYPSSVLYVDPAAAAIRSAEMARGVASAPSGDGASMYQRIRPGDRVTIVNRFGQQSTGRAVMLGPAGFVLNMGGAHGTPAIASPENIVSVHEKRGPRPSRHGIGEPVMPQAEGLHCEAMPENGSWALMYEERVLLIGSEAEVREEEKKVRGNPAHIIEGGAEAGRRRGDSTAWHNTPEGYAKYQQARAEAQQKANESGYDYGVEANDVFKTFNVFMLPRAENRSGHELRCEVVHPENLSRTQPGHGPMARAGGAGEVRLLTLDGGYRGESVPARVGMLVRSRQGSDESTITRIDPAGGRIAVKPVLGGHEHWGDVDWFFAVESGGSRARAPEAREKGVVWLQRPDGVYWANATGGTYWLMPTASGDYNAVWMTKGGDQQDLGTMPLQSAMQVAGRHDPATGRQQEYAAAPHRGDSVRRNRENLTYSEWLAAANFGRQGHYPDNAHMRREWRNGVDPTEYAARGGEARAPHTPAGRVYRYVDGDVRAWVEMPENYDPVRISSADTTHDNALRVIDYPEAEKLGLHGREGQTIKVARRDWTLAQAKDAIRPLGLVISKKDGEYRVNFRGGPESTAYYTTDLDDAVATGKQMSAEGQHRSRSGRFMAPSRDGKKIVTTYSRMTPSEGEDEYPDEDHGWIDEEGSSMEPEDADETAVDNAVKFLKNEGALEASGSHFYPGVWYSTEYYVTDYGTGEEEQRSFHLKGFTPDEERSIWHKMALGWERASRRAGAPSRRHASAIGPSELRWRTDDTYGTNRHWIARTRFIDADVYHFGDVYEVRVADGINEDRRDFPTLKDAQRHAEQLNAIARRNKAAGGRGTFRGHPGGVNAPTRDLPEDLKPVLGTLSHNRDFTVQDLREYTRDRPTISRNADALVRKLVKMGYLKQTPSRGHYYPTTEGWAWIEGTSAHAAQ